MATCPYCNREMLEAEGCITHFVMLEDGTVLEHPRHDVDGSHHGSDNRCHDCGAEPGGIHHAHCDSARQPDGSQILIEAAVYFDADVHADPRESESDYVFAVLLESEESPTFDNAVRCYDSVYAARKYVAEETWGEFEIRVLELEHRYEP